MDESYKKILVELYKENQAFLNKAIFGVATLAMPLLFQVLHDEKVLFGPKVLLWLSLFGFFLVITFQIFSLKAARDGCDKSLEGNAADTECGEKLFNRARRLDKWRERFFVLSFFLIVLAMVFNILPKEINMTQGQGSKGRVMIGQDSFTPPKAMVTQNKPATPPPAPSRPAQSQSTTGGNQGKAK